MMLSPNFTLEELTYCEYAMRRDMNNIPPKATVETLRILCENVLEPLHLAVGNNLKILSGYREHMVNIAVNGTDNSLHKCGQAVDFVIKGVTIVDAWKNIALGKYGDIKYDQLVYEYETWVHMSYKPINYQRSMILSARKNLVGKITYASFIPEQLIDIKEII